MLLKYLIGSGEALTGSVGRLEVQLEDNSLLDSKELPGKEFVFEFFEFLCDCSEAVSGSARGCNTGSGGKSRGDDIRS